jgi:ATP-binding cassette subfamily F protein uup
VVSHDRYVVERVCDDIHALTEDGERRHLPGGIEQYLADRRAAAAAAAPAPAPSRAGQRNGAPAGAVLRAARKEVARLERAIERLSAREVALEEQMAAAATDHVRLRALQGELAAARSEREALEAAWLQSAETLEPG